MTKQSKHVVSYRESKKRALLHDPACPAYLDILLNGERVGEASWNMRGYHVSLPMLGGKNFDPGEVTVAKLKRAIADVNRWAKQDAAKLESTHA